MGNGSVTRTSTTHPIRVDWLPLMWSGRVGLTFAPGKKDMHAATGIWDRSLETDVRLLRDEFAVDRLVCLLEDHELKALGIPVLVDAASAVGMNVARFPVPDGGLPRDEPAFRELVAQIVEWAVAGERVVIHCRGGLGRAGTTGGCVLVASGLPPADALVALREARGPNCPETVAQRRYIERFRAAS